MQNQLLMLGANSLADLTLLSSKLWLEVTKFHATTVNLSQNIFEPCKLR